MTGISMTVFRDLFLDTGAYIALIHAEDQYHRSAAAFYQQVAESVRRVTTHLVIAEAYAWLRYKIGYHESIRFLDTVQAAEEGGFLTVVHPDAGVDRRGRQLLRRYADQMLSYVDAISLAVLDDLPRETAVFAFDHHLSLSGRLVLPGAGN